MQRYSEAGALIAENDEEWLSGLEGMLDDEAYLEKSRTIRDMTLELANIDAQADGLLRLLEKIRHVNHA
jgi:hypothetical protein